MKWESYNWFSLIPLRLCEGKIGVNMIWNPKGQGNRGILLFLVLPGVNDFEPQFSPVSQQVVKVEAGDAPSLATSTSLKLLFLHWPQQARRATVSSAIHLQESGTLGFRGQRCKLNFLERKIERTGSWHPRAVDVHESQGGSEYNFRNSPSNHVVSGKECQSCFCIVIIKMDTVTDARQLLSILHTGFPHRCSYPMRGRSCCINTKNVLTLSDCVLGLNPGTKI